MVCAKRTLGSEIICKHLVERQGDKAQVEARFSPFGDSAYLDAR
jgi:hypothetical protein